jgi:hypothetical protein
MRTALPAIAGLMNRLVALSLLLLGTVAYACGPRARSSEPERRKVVEGPPIISNFDVKIRDGIEFDFRVTNNTDRKLELLFPSGQTHEVVVVDSVGREVWRWSEGRMFTQAIQNKLLESSAALGFTAAWRAKVPPGRYVAIGSLLRENKPIAERVEFDDR